MREMLAILEDGYGVPRRLCSIPGTDGSDPADRITVPVAPQKQLRQTSDAVYCSCRCKNADGKTDDAARYCECPDGFNCVHLIDDIGLGSTQLAGGYCVKSGSEFDEAKAEASPECHCGTFDCGGSDKHCTAP